MVYVLMQGINQACMTFTSQNMGARQYKRVRMSPLITIVIVGIAGLALCMLMLAFATPLAALFNSDAQVLSYAVMRMQYTFPLYFIFGIMQTFASQMRGMGHSFLPMAVSITGICGIRVGWLYTFFAADRTLAMLYIGYPVSWTATMVILMVCYAVILRKLPRENAGAELRAQAG
jgi:Na+-driven multidrug efflux pump